METMNYVNGYTFETILEDGLKTLLKDKRVKVIQSIGNSGMDTTNGTALLVYPHIESTSFVSCNCLQCKPRALYAVARDITSNWNPVWFGAVPYLQALRGLCNVEDDYGADDGKTMVIYFLSNAATWKGPHAKRIKAELKYYAGLK